MAKSKPFSLLLCMLAFLCVSSSLPAQAVKSDFLYLTLTWPGSTCSSYVDFCCMPTTGEPAKDFYVESFETYDSYAEKMVSNCSSTSTCTFFVNQLKNFIDDMHAYWPDVSCPCKNGVSKWKSTFCEFGTCSNLTQQQYFQRALALRKEIDPLAILAKQRIVPITERGAVGYKLADIESALRTKYPFSFVLECTRHGKIRPGLSMFLLHKIRYCVSMDGKKVITCPISKETNCADYVQFPVFSYNMMEGNEMNHIEMSTKRDETM